MRGNSLRFTSAGSGSIRLISAHLNQKEIAQNALKGNGGIAKTADFVAAVINKYEVAALCTV